MLKNILVILGSVIIIIGLFFPTRHASYYSYVPTEDITKELLYSKNAVINSKLPNCSYESLILNRRIIEVDQIFERKKFDKPLKGKVV